MFKKGPPEGAKRKDISQQSDQSEAKRHDNRCSQHILTSEPDVSQSLHMETFWVASGLHCGSSDLF